METKIVRWLGNGVGIADDGSYYSYEREKDAFMLMLAKKNDSRKFVIPDFVDGEKVVSVCQHVLKRFADCEEIVFSDNIVDIEECAFANNELKKVVFGKGLESIGADAFQYSNYLEEVAFPESLICIDQGAFFKCGRLKNIFLNSGLRFVGKYAFYGCPFEELVVPRSVKRIDKDSLVSSGASVVRFSSGIAGIIGSMTSSPSKLHCEAVIAPKDVLSDSLYVYKNGKFMKLCFFSLSGFSDLLIFFANFMIFSFFAHI